MFYYNDDYYTGGYCGNSMSNRAVAAYEYGAKPKSKWSKQIIISNVLMNNKNLTETDLKKLSKIQLFNLFLVYDSWHHTSSAYNKTSFYALRNDYDEITKEMLPKPERKERTIKTVCRDLYITARVKYKISTKTRYGKWHSEWVDDVVYFRSNDKIIKTSNGNKRKSSLIIDEMITQKTKYANANKLTHK